MPDIAGLAFLMILFRWIHFLAGITWIGLLYFLNLVNVRFVPSMDASIRPTVVPLLLKDLQAGPEHWLVALNAITGEDPVPEGSTFKEAVEAWLSWGREHGLLQSPVEQDSAPRREFEQ